MWAFRNPAALAGLHKQDIREQELLKQRDQSSTKRKLRPTFYYRITYLTISQLRQAPPEEFQHSW
jgi:hypothetical protein